jgi:hypothetical protein
MRSRRPPRCHPAPAAAHPAAHRRTPRRAPGTQHPLAEAARAAADRAPPRLQDTVGDELPVEITTELASDSVPLHPPVKRLSSYPQ